MTQWKENGVSMAEFDVYVLLKGFFDEMDEMVVISSVSNDTPTTVSEIDDVCL